MTAPGAGIEVAGDLAVGWQLVVPLADGTEDGIAGGAAAPADAGGRGLATAWVASLPGGAALLGRLLSDAVAATGAPIGPVLAPGLPAAALAEPAYDGVARQYSLWRPYPKNTAGTGTVWRQAQLLGLQAAGPDGALPGSRDALAAGEALDSRAARDGGDGADAAGPACLVIEDTGLGFRSTPEAWPASLRRLGEAGRPKPHHVVLRQVSALGTGPLWEHLLANAGDRLTVCCNVAGLRAEQAEIGQPLSWERTASEVVRAIDRHPTLRAAGRVVVTLGMCGAVAIERGGARTLIYDPLHQEGDWEAQRPGMPIGNDVAVAVALVMAYAQEESGAGWLAALARGLTAGRLVHDGGFLAGGVPGLAAESAGALRFPIREAMPLLTGAREATAFERVAIPPQDDWTILAARAAGGTAAVAARIAEEGVVAAGRGVPVERMGAWTSIDRIEIESLRSVRNIVQEYLRHPRPRPLNLAVFGPPGSGKSFAIKQMARAWTAGGVPLAVLEFNLSQFASPADLPVALQRVRDCTVEGRLPLVFWDEFDAAQDGRALGWLASFLAPMQDGTFVESGAVRPIGAAVFVFAGGTNPTMGAFKARAVEHAAAKATDFLSRLRGYIDTLGPNPSDADDQTYVLRRALLLRAVLSGRAPRLAEGGRLRVDPGVLRAFLGAPAYVHGARSMESIVEMSALTGAGSFERAALPAAHQLAIHVDAPAFLALLRPPDEEP